MHERHPCGRSQSLSRTAAGQAGCWLAARAMPRAPAERGATASPGWPRSRRGLAAQPPASGAGASPLAARAMQRSSRDSSSSSQSLPRRRDARPVSPAAAYREGNRYTALWRAPPDYVCGPVTQAAAAARTQQGGALGARAPLQHGRHAVVRRAARRGRRLRACAAGACERMARPADTPQPARAPVLHSSSYSHGPSWTDS